MTNTFAKTLIAYGSPDSPPLFAGMMVDGRYRLDEPLGEGSFGVVWRATHVLMKKRVAIKFLHTDLERHSESLARFRREAQAAANISHPNVCIATDFGQTEAGALYLVMEFLEGFTLDELLAEQGRLPASRVIDLGAQIADGLHAAHSRGITHLDLKPENLMISMVDGVEVVKILDFGIAKVPREIEETVEQGGVRQTQTRRVHGTPGYMAPEQIADGALGPGADLYALGVVLYEMLAGRLPFDDDDLVELLTKHLRDPAPPLSSVAADAQIPDGLDALVMRLLEKRPERRFESAQHVRDALRAMSTTPPKRGTASWSPSQSPNVTPAPAPATPERPLTARSLEAIGAPPWLMPAVIAAGVTAVLMVVVVIVAIIATRGEPQTAGEASEQAAAQEAEADAGAGEAGPDVSTLEGARDALRARPEVRAAMESLAMGEPSEALSRFAALVEAEPQDPHLRYLDGLAAMRAKKYDRALGAYVAATRYDARYGEDKTLLADLPTALKAGKGESLDALIALMKERPPAGWEALLAQVAASATNSKARRAAQDALEGAGLWDRQRDWVKDAYALWGADACPAQTKLIKALGESGQQDATPVLRYWSRKPTKGCGFLRRKDCHECIRAPLRAALRKIKNSQTDDPDDAPTDAPEPADDAN